MNTKLLKQVRDAILREPRRVNMTISLTEREGPRCGTVGCIAGWTLMLDEHNKQPRKGWGAARVKILEKFADPVNWGAFPNWRKMALKARKLLGITREQAEGLFHVGNWPADAQEAYEAADFRSSPDRAKELARVVAKRINQFIRTGK